MLRSSLSRSTQVAFSAMGYTAEIHAESDPPLSPMEIARSRDLQAPFLGKILVNLSRHGLIDGWRGPGGGYRLSRDPKSIRLHEVADLYEREGTAYVCPYGKDYCGNGPHCPLHNQLESLNKGMDKFLWNRRPSQDSRGLPSPTSGGLCRRRMCRNCGAVLPCVITTIMLQLVWGSFMLIGLELGESSIQGVRIEVLRTRSYTALPSTNAPRT